MAYRIRNLTTALLLVVAGGADLLRAQDGPPPIELRFSAYAVKRPDEPIMVEPRAGGRAVALRFYTNQRSPALDYRGANPVWFFTEVPNPQPDPARPTVRRPLGYAHVPEGVTRPLFIFFPGAEPSPDDPSPLPYRIYVFDDGPGNLPAGRVALLNASGLEYLGKFNDVVRPVTAGLNPPIDAGPSLRIELRTAVRGKYYQAYLNQHALAADERALLLFLPPLHRGSIEPQVRVLLGKAETPGGAAEDTRPAGR